MFLFTIHAVPDLAQQDKDLSDIGGAYVCAWINFPDQEGAEILARFYIKDAGWIDDDELCEETKWVDGSNPNDESYQYYKEALEHGSSLVFHQYPKEEEKYDNLH